MNAPGLHEEATDAAALIARYGLQPHPEGGWYRRIYTSGTRLAAAQGERPAVTSILYLLRAGEVSRWHRVRADELWHFCAGAALTLWRADTDLKRVAELRLGLHASALPMQPVPAGCWQAARSTGDYTLVCCSVTPGFEFADFTLMADDASACAALRALQPQLALLL